MEHSVNEIQISYREKLSTLKSVATLFSIDIVKKHIRRDISDCKLVVVGKVTSTILTVVAIFAAPLMANAPDGLYQLLQELNGIYFIPIASILLAGFFMKRVSATAAKTGKHVFCEKPLDLSFDR